MDLKKPPTKPQYSVWRRIGRILLKTVIILLLIVVALFFLIQTPPAQNFARKKIETFLQTKLNTVVRIGRINLSFPRKLVLENVYFEDQLKDTLLSGGRMRVDLSMLKLLRNEVEVNEIQLEDITAKVKRILPDTAFNFQFIIDALTKEQKKPRKATDSAALKLNVKSIIFDNIRIVYKDVVTGNDMDAFLQHFDTRIDTFNVSNLQFNIPVTRIKGLHARFHQTTPLIKSIDPLSEDIREAKKPIDFKLNFKEVALNDIVIDYKNDVSSFYTQLDLGDLMIHPDKIDFQNRVIDLRDLLLNNTNVAIQLGKKQQARLIAKEVGEEIQSHVKSDWTVKIGDLELNNNNIKFDDDNKPTLRRGMDYSHLKADQLTLHANDFFFSLDSIAGSITKGNFKEQSGFQLNELQTDFVYAKTQAYLHNLYLRTPGTILRRSAEIRYPSMKALQKDIGVMQIDLDIPNSQVQVNDILTFAPALRSQPAFAHGGTWKLSTRVRGSIRRLVIDKLQFTGFSQTNLDIRGVVAGLPDINKTSGNLSIYNISSGRKDIQLLAPKGSLPKNITLPERFNLRGNIAGGMTAVTANLNLNSTLGSAAVNGSLQNATNTKLARYQAKVITRGLNLGILLKNPQNLGPVSANFTVKGTGFDPKIANATVQGVVNSAVIKKYNYRNLTLDASIANQRVSANAKMNDPNIHFAMIAQSDLSQKFPSIRLKANIDSIKTLPLHLTTQSVIYRGNIDANFPVSDPDNLIGEALITKSLIVNEGQRMELDTLRIAAGRSDSGQFVRLTSDIASVELNGQYRLTQLGDIFIQSVQPYWNIVPNYAMKRPDPYDFKVTAGIINSPFLQTFLPDLTELQPMTFQGHFSSASGMQATLDAPLIINGPLRFDNVQMAAATGPEGLVVNTTFQQFKNGTAMSIYRTRLNAVVANNAINFSLNIRDKSDKNKYHLAGLFNQPQQQVYHFSLRPDSLLLNYDRWSINNNNKIQIHPPEGIIASNFVLNKDEQQLSINSLSQSYASPLRVDFSNFKLATLTAFMQNDTMLVNGTLQGNIVFSELMKQPTFTTDLLVNDLSFRGDTLGNVTAKVNNTVQNTFAANVTVTGHGNDIALTGTYNVKPANNSTFDLNLDVRQLQLNTIEGATMGAISNASGYLNGKFVINGTISDPNIDGELNFNNAGFNLAMVNSYFRIDQEKISVNNNEGIRFDSFTIRDSTGNAAVLDGMAYTKNFINYRFDMTFNAENFQALNSTKQQNKLFYGQLYFTSTLHIQGTERQPVVDGSLKVNEDTRMTIVLPQRQPGIEDREGIVQFVDMDGAPNDSLFLTAYDSLNISQITGFDITTNIEIDRNAEFNLIIDEGNGDFLKVKGEALLNAGIDPSGKITLSGSYELFEGSYELSFNFLKRKFNIQKGSRIVWNGEPKHADLDVTAVYVANTSPLDLVEQQLGEATTIMKNYYRQKLPFEVYLKLQGELMKPEISFDVVLPPDKHYSVSKDVLEVVNIRLDQLRQEPGEMNKQVFALLLLNRFVNENPFQSSGGFDAGDIARQSVSKLLAEQLNRLVENLIAGVDINFDVVSEDDYTSGVQENRTDLNVSLSKRMLNDRLTVSVGSNFELEGPRNTNQASSNIAGNIAVDYQLSQDGRYRIRAYRKNEYEGVLEGYVIETGVGFIISLDYNYFKEILRAKKAMKEKQKQPQANPDATKVQPVSAVASSENE